MIPFIPDQLTQPHSCVITDTQTNVVAYDVSPWTELFDLSKLSKLEGFKPESSYTYNYLSAHQDEYEAARYVQSLFPGVRPLVSVVQSKKVLCVTTGKLYDNQLQAAKDNNINQANLSKHLRSPDTFKTCGGRVFKYASPDIPLPPTTNSRYSYQSESCAVIKPSQSAQYHTFCIMNDEYQPVFYDVDVWPKVFDSVQSLINLPSLKRDRKYYFMMTGSFEKEYKAINHLGQLFKSRSLPVLKREYIAQKQLGGLIKCVETGQIFRSQAEACRILGVHSGQMACHIARKPGFKTVKGLTFERTSSWRE